MTETFNETLHALIKSEQVLFESRKDLFNQLIAKKDSCRRRIAWVMEWWEPFMKLERNLDVINNAIEAEAQACWMRAKENQPGTTADLFSQLKYILSDRLDKLVAFYQAERIFWQQIGFNIDATLLEDIHKCTLAKESLKNKEINTTLANYAI